jgi:acyl-CoA reductase-like NAD-dependent aldehyde dehydrogenase
MKYCLLIGGRLVEGAGHLDVIDPATGEVFEAAPRADEAQLENAISEAKRAFPGWAALSHVHRREYLLSFASAVEARQKEFAVLLTREQGKPLPQAEFEIMASVAALRYFADQDLPLETIRETETDKILEQRTPLGVVAAIIPWNFPMAILMLKIAPALITGNTLVAKPAPTTPLTACLLGEVAAAILPPGVLNIVVDNNDLGQKLTSHPDIAKVSFTGSTATGKRVMGSAAETLKRVTLELGGNDAAIVLDDVNIRDVAGKVFNAAMVNAGQVCLAAKRVYVPESLYDEFCAELARIAEGAVVGSGLDNACDIGPVQNRQQYEKVINLINDARRTGKIVAGGETIDGGGYFIRPTIVKDIDDDEPLVKDEQFGPVIPIMAYQTVEDMVRRVNDSQYGLGGTIWTSDVDRGLSIALKIETGTIWINKHLDTPFDIPFGGAKSSGIGREGGQEGLKEYTQAKIINIAKETKACRV